MSNKHGKIAEDTVESICYQLFGRDLVLRSPGLIEGSGTKELTDILIIIDDTAIIIQSKSLQIDISDLDTKKFDRIRRRQEKAKVQLNTALNALQRNAHANATTPMGINFNIDWSIIKHKIGIVTLSIPDSSYADPEFRFQYPWLVEEHKGIIVHTFLINDLKNMTFELTTAGDVLLYLNIRSQCVKSFKFIIGNELDFLALFKTQYPQIEKALSDPAYHVFIAPGLWEGYRSGKSDKIEERENRFKNSFLIDNMITKLHMAVEYSAHKYALTSQESALNYLSLIGKLSKLSRIQRAKIGDRLTEEFEKTKVKKYCYFVTISEFADTAYLFLILNEEDSEKRKSFLNFLCEQACHSVKCSEIIGIVTHGAKNKGPSFEAIGLSVEEIRSTTEPDPELQMFGQPVYEKMNEWDS
jgi:hypothetical protein